MWIIVYVVCCFAYGKFCFCFHGYLNFQAKTYCFGVYFDGKFVSGKYITAPWLWGIEVVDYAVVEIFLQWSWLCDLQSLLTWFLSFSLFIDIGSRIICITSILSWKFQKIKVQYVHFNCSPWQPYILCSAILWLHEFDNITQPNCSLCLAQASGDDAIDALQQASSSLQSVSLESNHEDDEVTNDNEAQEDISMQQGEPSPSENGKN